MRILLAVDGSISSDRATELVASLALPGESLDPGHRGPAALRRCPRAVVGARPTPAATWSQRRSATPATCARPSSVRSWPSSAPRPTVEGFLLRGRPASAIVDEAGAFDADMVVMGSRGHGTIATMVLGSTAAEVVDHAPCPVLVARRRHARGRSRSPTMARHRPGPPRRCSPAGRSSRTATSASSPSPRSPCPSPRASRRVSTTRCSSRTRGPRTRPAKRWPQESSGAAHRLAEAGLHAVPVALEGDAAAEIIRFAAERTIGTIVMGTRGRTGLARLFLGSIARNVLLHAHSSVLVVRATR